MKTIISVLGLLLVFWPIFSPLLLYAEEGEDPFAQAEKVSRKQAILLSLGFPGLGQVSSGYKWKGTGLLALGVASLAFGITAHANYKTRLTEFNNQKIEYEALERGGSYAAAAEKWKGLVNTRDDLDRLHLIRWVEAAASMGIYIYNVVDILYLSTGSSEGEAFRTEPSLRLVLAQEGKEQPFWIYLTRSF